MLIVVAIDGRKQYHSAASGCVSAADKGPRAI